MVRQLFGRELQVVLIIIASFGIHYERVICEAFVERPPCGLRRASGGSLTTLKIESYSDDGALDRFTHLIGIPLVSSMQDI